MVLDFSPMLAFVQIPAALLWFLLSAGAGAGAYLGADEIRKRGAKKLEKEMGKLGKSQANELRAAEDVVVRKEQESQSNLATSKTIGVLESLLSDTGAVSQGDVNRQVGDLISLDAGGQLDASEVVGREMAKAIGSSPEEIKNIAMAPDTLSDFILKLKEQNKHPMNDSSGMSMGGY